MSNSPGRRLEKLLPVPDFADRPIRRHEQGDGNSPQSFHEHNGLFLAGTGKENVFPLSPPPAGAEHVFHHIKIRCPKKCRPNGSLFLFGHIRRENNIQDGQDSGIFPTSSREWQTFPR